MSAQNVLVPEDIVVWELIAYGVLLSAAIVWIWFMIITGPEPNEQVNCLHRHPVCVLVTSHLLTIGSVFGVASTVGVSVWDTLARQNLRQTEGIIAMLLLLSSFYGVALTRFTSVQHWCR
jgi:hypothetical protein